MSCFFRPYDQKPTHRKVYHMYQELEKFIIYGTAFYLSVQIAHALAGFILFAAANVNQDFSTLFTGVGFIGLGLFPL
jgi:hypothetical protein